MQIVGRDTRALFLAMGIVGMLAAGCNRHKGDTVLARVGKLTITESEFRRKLGEVAQEYQNYVLTLNGRRQFLDVLIREKMILAAATDAGIAKSAEYKAQLDQLKAEEAERLAEGRDYLLTQLWLKNLQSRGIISVSDDEVRAYHDKHRTEVQVRHILLATPEEAEATLRKLRAGAGFANLAKEKSLDAETAADGGRMKPAIYGEIIPELEDVVFKSRIGETVGPIRSKFGYHVLRKESEYPVAISKAEDRIRHVLEKRKLDQYLQSMQSRYPVEVTDVQVN